MATADSANSWLRREQTRQLIESSFRVNRPDDGELMAINDALECAFDTVATARGDRSDTIDPGLRDYLECAALYAYVLGLAQRRAA